jgi:hypothetical protein
LEIIQERYDEEMVKFVDFLIQLDCEQRPSTKEIINYLQSMSSEGNVNFFNEEGINSFSKNEKQLREENLQLSLKCEECKPSQINLTFFSKTNGRK